MELVIVNGDDWEGLYINGVLVTEGHSISNRELAEAIIERLPRLNISYECKEADIDWLHDRGSLPEKLEKVKLNG